MTKLIISFVTIASLATIGCGKKGAAGELDKLKDEACACTTKECGDAVDKKLEAAIEKLSPDGKEPDEDTAKAVMGTMMEAGLCLSKLKK